MIHAPRSRENLVLCWRDLQRSCYAVRRGRTRVCTFARSTWSPCGVRLVPQCWAVRGCCCSHRCSRPEWPPHAETTKGSAVGPPWRDLSRPMSRSRSKRWLSSPAGQHSHLSILPAVSFVEVCCCWRCDLFAVWVLVCFGRPSTHTHNGGNGSVGIYSSFTRDTVGCTPRQQQLQQLQQ